MTPHPNPAPIHCMPRAIQQSIFATSQITQAPLSLILNAHLGALAIASQYCLKVRRPGGHESPTSLFIADIVPSGERKTTVHNEVLRPIREFARKEKNRVEPLLETFRAEIAEWEAQRKDLHRLRRVARRAEQSCESLNKQIGQLMKEKPARPKAFRLIIQDATYEAVAQRLHEDYPTIALVVSEGGVVFGSPIFRNLAIANSLWSSESLEIARATKDTIHIVEPKFSVLVATQAEVLRKFLLHKGDIAHQSGFTSRFLFSEGMPTQGFRMITGEEYSRDAIIIFHARLTEILESTHVTVAPDDTREPYIAQYDQTGGWLWTNYFNEVEIAQRPGGYLSDVPAAASKSAEMAARISALLQYFEHGPSAINAENSQRGIDLARWYLLEHKRLFGLQPEVPEDERDAVVLEQWLRERCWRHGGCPSFPRNEILKFGPHRLRNRNRREAALLVLSRTMRVRVQVHNKTNYVVLNPGFFPVSPEPAPGQPLPPCGAA